MPFVYANSPHVRRHGPAGYTDYTSYKPWLRDDFLFRCVYCLERERWYPSGHAAFGVDHVQPQGNPNNLALICYYGNLVYACNRCNSAKRDRVLPDPCATALADHVRITDDGTIAGLSPEGRRLILILGLDTPGPQAVRERYLRAQRLYQNNPTAGDVREMYIDYFGFPDDLPELAELRPPGGNSRPEGMRECHSRQRAEGRLPEVYFPRDP